MSGRAGGASRREVLAAALCALALPLLPATGAGGSLVSLIRRLLTPGSHANRQDAAAARRVLFGDEPPVGVPSAWSDAQIAARIRSNIADDFGNGRWVSVGGWQIAATEWHAVELMRRAQLS